MCGVIVFVKGQAREQQNTTYFSLVSHQRSLKQREIKYEVLISEPQKVQSSSLALIYACPCLQGRAGNLGRKNMLAESTLVKLAKDLYFIHNSATDLIHLYSSKKRYLFCLCVNLPFMPKNLHLSKTAGKLIPAQILVHAAASIKFINGCNRK